MGVAKKAKKTKGKAKTGKGKTGRAGASAPRRAAVRAPGRPLARTSAKSPFPSVQGVAVRGAAGLRYDEILTRNALSFVADLHRRFDATRKRLLARRGERQRRFDTGELPDFLAETKHIRDGNWKVGPIPKDLQDRRVELTGPVDRKMVINALNSGADVYMADFEDASSPTWANLIEGQINLKDYWAGKLSFVEPQTGKRYEPGKQRAVLIVRPRGWHLNEEHVIVDNEPVSGALFDFALYLFHNWKRFGPAKTGAYSICPRSRATSKRGCGTRCSCTRSRSSACRRGAIKATVLIETLPAAFEMDEILYELREHITGLNCGRWDYIFSFIKRLGKNKRFLTPDRGTMTMDRAFLRAYSLLLIKTCHRRGAFAMGGMAAQIPVRGDARKNDAAFAKVRADKEREAHDGNDGTWVAHPDLVPIAKEVFDKLMPKPNQLSKLRADVKVTRDQLLEVHTGERTESGLRQNIRVGIQYIEAWLRGRGAVPLYDLMEDAATAEISRAQVWQWLYHRAKLADGREVTPDLFRNILTDEMAKVRQSIGPTNYDSGRFPEAIQLFTDMSLALEFEEFLTVPAYRLIV